MYNGLGFSVYLSTFPRQRDALAGWAGTGAPVFLSLHISEEFGPGYCQQAEAVCQWLFEAGFSILADVSVKTRQQFGEPDLIRLAKRLHIWALRIDYGLSQEEILSLAREMPVVLNASTTTPEDAARIAEAGSLVMAMHNFYPRPETGLDDSFLLESTRALQAAGLRVLAFLPGDGEKRGPIGQGLPTLERHRDQLPSACFADLALRFHMDGIFLGDPGISQVEQERIRRFCDTGALSIPAILEPEYQNLYGRTFTSRPDSPASLVRFAESRTYSCTGGPVEPAQCLPRDRGVITMDNREYGRYSGEIQLIRASLPADPRVNVIGRLPELSLLLADCIQRGSPFSLVPAEPPASTF